MHVFLTPRARRDASRIIAYYEEETGSADWFAEAFQQALMHLERFPLSGSPYRSALSGAVRVWLFKRYNCFYRVQNNSVQVLTVLHTSRDAPKTLKAIE